MEPQVEQDDVTNYIDIHSNEAINKFRKSEHSKEFKELLKILDNLYGCEINLNITVCY